MPLALRGQVPLGRFRQRQLPQIVLDDCLPYLHDAQVGLVVAIAYGVAGRGW